MKRRSFLGGLLGLIPTGLLAGDYPWPGLDQYQWPKECKKDGRPIVRFYVSKSCEPCRQAKKELTVKIQSELPFRLIEIDVESGEWTEEVPAFVFDTPNGRKYWKGFPGVKKLVEIWKFNQKRVVGNGYPAMVGYQPRWSWPNGSLKVHLMQRHGVPNISLTQDQCEWLHDYLHEGGSLLRLKSMFQ